MGGCPESNLVFKVDRIHCRLIHKAPMLTKKWAHSLCLMNKFIYSIGGHSECYLQDCLKYDVIHNKWSQLPKLNMERGTSASFAFNDVQLYTIGGGTESGDTDTIEKLETKGWEYVNIKNMFSARRMIQGIQISEFEVLVFGGEHDESKEYHILHLKDARDGKWESVQYENTFKTFGFYFCPSPVSDGIYVYAVNNKKKAFKYSISDAKWTQINDKY